MPIDLDYEYGPADDGYYSIDQLAEIGVIWPDDITAALKDVMAERERQVTAEGWTPEHDDEHRKRELASAAATYALAASFNSSRRQYVSGIYSINNSIPLREMWPWDATWWKPSTPRRGLVKAAALILAEIERLDRLPPSHTPAETGAGGE